MQLPVAGEVRRGLLAHRETCDAGDLITIGNAAVDACSGRQNRACKAAVHFGVPISAAPGHEHACVRPLSTAAVPSRTDVTLRLVPCSTYHFTADDFVM